MLTAIYSILHMLVDGVCAFFVFAKFSQGNYESFLVYNFCAFALQMPIGTVLDGLCLNGNKQKRAYICAVLGVVFTVIGAFTHPGIIGIGNALFHVGGGVGVIEEDFAKNRKGQALGIFVAPGAFGLFVGTQLANRYSVSLEIAFLVVVSVAMVVLLVLLQRNLKYLPVAEEMEGENPKENMWLLLIGCFLVVILRSYVGMAVGFSWKTTWMLGLISVLAVVGGKMAGGILAARIGMKKAMIGSLILAAICYCWSHIPVMGIWALFFFNMTMPITLYLLVKRFRKNPGFSFGLLTFGLFLGFLPVYYEVSPPLPGYLLGAVGSILSLILLLVAVRKVGEKQDVLS